MNFAESLTPEEVARMPRAGDVVRIVRVTVSYIPDPEPERPYFVTVEFAPLDARPQETDLTRFVWLTGDYSESWLERLRRWFVR